MAVANVSLATSPDTDNGTCSFGQPGLCWLITLDNTTLANTTVAASLAKVPWTYYGFCFASLFGVGIFILFHAVIRVPWYIYVFLKRVYRHFLLSPIPFLRGLFVFALSITSLSNNFFGPYMFWTDGKLNHQWHAPLPTEDRKAARTDFALNIALLMLLVFKPVKFKCWNDGSVPFIPTGRGYSRFFRGFCKPARLAASVFNLLRDWEFVSNMANLPLVFYEICIVACVDYTMPGLWKVAVISLQFLRLFCLIWFCDEIIRIFPKLPLKIGTVMRRITWIACCFLSCAAWIQLMEILGDFWLQSYNGQKDLSYGKVVTFLYGKLVFLDVTSAQLETTTAKISVYIVQAITLIFLVQIIPEMLKQLPRILKIRAFDTVYRKRDTKYVALLGSINPDAVERFAGTFRSTNPGENIAVLLEPEASDDATEEMNTVAGKYRDILTIVSGSVFKKQDLKNVISKHCQCAFFFANESAPNFTAEDHCNFLRVHALKRYHPKVRVIVKVLLYENKERFYDIPNWRKASADPSLQVDGIVCTAEIQFSLLAQRYFAPGISQVVYDWFSKPPKKKNRVSLRKLWRFLKTLRNSYAELRPSLAEGAEKRLSRSGRQTIRCIGYHTPMEKFLEPPRPFLARVREQVLRYAQSVQMRCCPPEVQNTPAEETPLQQVQNETTIVVHEPLNPSPKKIQLYKDIEAKFKGKGILFAVLQEEIFHLYPRENLILKDGAKLFFITSASVNLLQRTLCENCFDNKKRQLGLACDPESVTVCTNCTKNMIPQLQTMTASMEENKDEIWDPTGQYRHYQSTKGAIPLKCADEKDSELSTLEQHVVICVISDRSATPIGLVNFIKPLRSVHAVPPVVVILGEPDFLATEWDSLRDFPNIYPVKGTPLNDNHLRAINIQASRMCLIVDASERPQEESEKWSLSANADLIWPILPKHFYRHVNAVLATVAITEYLKRTSERKDLLIEQAAKVIEEILKRYNIVEDELGTHAVASAKAQLKTLRKKRDQFAEMTMVDISKLLKTTGEQSGELLEFLKRIRQANDTRITAKWHTQELCQNGVEMQEEHLTNLTKIMETYRTKSQKLVQKAVEEITENSKTPMPQTNEAVKGRRHEDFTEFVLGFQDAPLTVQTVESVVLACFNLPRETDPLPEYVINEVTILLQYRSESDSELQNGANETQELLATLFGRNTAVIQKAETLLRRIRGEYDPMQEDCIKVMQDFADSFDTILDSNLKQIFERFREENYKSLRICVEQIIGKYNLIPEKAELELIQFLKHFREACDPLPEEILTCIHHDAVGLISWSQAAGNSAKPKVSADCTKPNIVDALMLKCYEDNDIFDATRLLLLGGYCDAPKQDPEGRVSGCPYLGNQAVLSKLSSSYTKYSSGRVWRGLKKYNPLSADIDRCALGGQQDKNEKVQFHKDLSMKSLSEKLAKRNLLILAPESAVHKRETRNNQNYFALERPFHVVARQKLFAEVLDDLNLEGDANQVIKLEFLPSYILKAIAEKNSGLPARIRNDQHQDWFYAYYRIIDKVANHSEYQSPTLKDAFSKMSPDPAAFSKMISDPAEYHKKDQADKLPMLPKSILNFVLATYYHKKLGQKPSPKSTIPVKELFYKRQEMHDDNATHITWSDLALVPWKDFL
ncbi:uncharacterized protein LOC129597459 isoform X2 [Paramacrobiotus metropolitanus]|uniref:uncharacterized protein LOC129597459 isoform X2 n=1 Tax=Paramacrobiotus metropolitanus TaxID=2943436 RepID=UPI0024456DEB|nr:uncharacterized protein LOC129597459 isoform X2 [Paramacrobiotus metropolitanus]